jgi:hypothetical protein
MPARYFAAEDMAAAEALPPFAGGRPRAATGTRR